MRSQITHFSRYLLASATALLVCLSFAHTYAADGGHGGAHGSSNNKQANQGDIKKTSEAVQASRKKAEYAAKGMAPNPIAFDFDPQGNLYVINAGRAGISVLDNRKPALRNSNGVLDDLQKTSVEDRLRQINMLEEKGFAEKGTFTKSDDKIHFLQDTDGDGVADKTSIFAENFNGKLDGIAAGVLYHEGKLFLTNIPNLWLLEDKDGDGDADLQTEGERISMSYGYGVRWTFVGHDMHGLIKGPDGRIYWSIGDRGFNVKTKEGNQLYDPGTGGVFRMWPDGSGLEVFHRGLRNPQELAFDNYGNLFTGENNSDGGDLARFVFVAEGGETGWSQDVQSLKDRGPWNREKMWAPRIGKGDPSQPMWIIPPIINVGRGPSGIAHYPGVGDVFPKNGSFLLCDYPAGVRHVHLEPEGAYFRAIEDSGLEVEGTTITDVAWGYDGRIYYSDWGGGWSVNPNGTIKTLANEAAHKEQAELIKQVQDLFANGFDKISDEDLASLLGHADQRVRLNAHWELARRPAASSLLAMVVSKGNFPEDRREGALRDIQASEFHRLHALWALGIQARKNPAVVKDMLPGLKDTSEQVRAQAASVLGDLGGQGLSSALLGSLSDESAVVRYQAAIALGKVGNADHIEPLLELLARNDNADPSLIHAASYALSLIGDAEVIHAQAQTRGPAERLGAVLALRRLNSPQLVDYLRDQELIVSAEAARAIYDKRVEAAMPVLAAHADNLTQAQMIEPIIRRVIEANVRLADRDSAMRLARLAEGEDVPVQWRMLALKELEQWSAERNREGVWGAWWPRPEQTMDHAVAAMTVYIPGILATSEGDLNTLARTMLQKYVANASPEQLEATALSSDEPDIMRVGTLKLLVEADPERAKRVAETLVASESNSPSLRIDSRRVLIKVDKSAGELVYADAIVTGTLAEQQDAIDQLGRVDGAVGAVPSDTFTELADQLAKGTLDPALKLDLIEAVNANKGMPDSVRLKVSQYIDRNKVAVEEPFLRDTVLAGGSIERGRDVFYYNEGASCTQCHRMDNEPAQGPNLAAIGAMYDIGYLYTAIVQPSADIAEGYAQTSVTLKDGNSLSGRMLSSQSTPEQLVLIDAQNKIIKIDRMNIEGRPLVSQQSNMKAMNDALSPRELRDLLAFLASLQDVSAGSAVATQASAVGPKIINSAKSINHAWMLPVILLSIAVGLALILLPTWLMGGRPAPGAAHS